MDEALKDIVRKMVDDPTCKIQLFSGMKQTNDTDDGNKATYKPTGGRTIVLETNGGANNVEIRHVKTEDDE